MTKLFDRLIEINKLSLQYPDIRLLINDANLKEETISEWQNSDKEKYCKLQSFSHLIINTLDEAFSFFRNKNFRGSNKEYKAWVSWAKEAFKYPAIDYFYHSGHDVWGPDIKKFFEEEIQNSSQKGGTEENIGR